MKKLLNKRKSLPPAQLNVYKNEDYEKARLTGKLDKYKAINQNDRCSLVIILSSFKLNRKKRRTSTPNCKKPTTSNWWTSFETS